MKMMDTIKQIVDNTDLSIDQILIAKSYWDGYNSVFCIKDNRIVKLGDYCYYIPNENCLEKLKIFVDLCIKKYKGEIDEVPSLHSNPEYDKDCYKYLGKGNGG